MDFLYSYDDIMYNPASLFVILSKFGKTKLKKNIVNSDAIAFSTIHGSKGLQSDTVILIDLGGSLDYRTTDYSKFMWYFDENFCERFVFKKKKKKMNKNDINIKKHIIDDLNKEDLRLLYVAITRAKNNFYIIGTKDLLEKKSYLSVVCDNLYQSS